MGVYVSAEEVRAFKIDGEVVSTSQFVQEDIDSEILLAEERIEILTGDWFYAKTLDIRLDGSGQATLFLHPRIPAPVVALTAVEEVDVDGTTVLNPFVENQDYVAAAHYLEVPMSDGRVRSMFGREGAWPKGTRNIRIRGSFGRSAVPKAIKRAAILLTLERLVPGSTKMGPADVVQAAWPDFSVTFKGGSTSLDSSGFAEVDRLLAPFVNMAGMFMSVPNTRQLHDESPLRT